jgi:hypothetical protein
MPAKPKRQLKPIREVDAAEYKRDLQRRVREYEHRYEVSTEHMREMVLSGERMDTDEIVKWLHAAWTIELLEGREEPEKNTDGSASTTTRKFTKAR